MHNFLRSIKTNVVSLTVAVVAVVIFIVGYVLFSSPDRGMMVWSYTHLDAFAVSISPRDAQLRFAIGDYYFGNGAYDLKKAERYFRDAVVLDPRLEVSHYQLARIYFINSNFSSALAEVNTEINLFPDFKRSYYVRGLIYGYMNKPDKAVSDFKTFLEWKPESWAGHNDLAWVYFMKGDYKNSAKTAREGLVYSPNNVWLLNSLGVALLNMKNLDEAEKTLTKALADADAMTSADWGVAYPGNNPATYVDGLDAMKASIERNLALIASKRAEVDK